MVTRHIPVEGEFSVFFNFSMNAKNAMFATFAVPLTSREVSLPLICLEGSQSIAVFAVVLYHP